MSKLTLDSFNSRKASETPFKMEYMLPDGTPSGFILHVIGDNAGAVVAERNRLINEDRVRVSAQQALAKPGQPLPINPVENDLSFVQKLAAARIVGWEGIDDAFTPDAAVQLMADAPEIREQVVQASQTVGNFTQRSPKGS